MPATLRERLDAAGHVDRAPVGRHAFGATSRKSLSAPWHLDGSNVRAHKRAAGAENSPPPLPGDASPPTRPCRAGQVRDQVGRGRRAAAQHAPGPGAGTSRR